MKYVVTKQVVVNAMQWRPRDLAHTDQVMAWLADGDVDARFPDRQRINLPDVCDGRVDCEDGDWIVIYADGDLIVVPDAVFHDWFAAVPSESVTNERNLP